MSIGDFVILEESASNGGRGSRKYNVGTGATVINPGEPVSATVTGAVVTRMYNAAITGIAQPVVATDYVVGIAATTSSNTTTTAGTVNVIPTHSGITWLVTPNAPTSWDTQAEYDALVGHRVLVDLTSGAYTVFAADATANGLVVMPLDISKYPGKVAVAFRQALSPVN